MRTISVKGTLQIPLQFVRVNKIAIQKIPTLYQLTIQMPRTASITAHYGWRDIWSYISNFYNKACCETTCWKLNLKRQKSRGNFTVNYHNTVWIIFHLNGYYIYQSDEKAIISIFGVSSLHNSVLKQWKISVQNSRKISSS